MEEQGEERREKREKREKRKERRNKNEMESESGQGLSSKARLCDHAG